MVCKGDENNVINKLEFNKLKTKLKVNKYYFFHEVNNLTQKITISNLIEMGKNVNVYLCKKKKKTYIKTKY